MSRILVIEDQKLLSQLYHSALATAKHTVVMVDNGEDGVAEALREKPDLVILDLTLPGISGSEVANALETLGVLPETPLIIATALGEAARSTADIFGAVALIPKPFHLNTLLTQVDAALSFTNWKQSSTRDSALAAEVPGVAVSVAA